MMARWRRCIGMTLLGGALLVTPAATAAATTSSDSADVRDQLFKLQKDTARLLDGMTQLQTAMKQQQAPPACAEAATRAQALENEVGALRESVAAATARLEEALVEIRALRLAAAAAPPSMRSGSVVDAEAGGNEPALDRLPPTTAAISPTDTFHAAYADYSRRLYDLALEGFGKVVATDPKGPLAGTAQYWIGETLLAQGKMQDAVAAFDKVLTGWPSGEKRLAAQLRKGIALADGGKRDEGRALLQQVIDGHPGSPEAQSAREYLKRKGLASR